MAFLLVSIICSFIAEYANWIYSSETVLKVMIEILQSSLFAFVDIIIIFMFLFTNIDNLLHENGTKVPVLKPPQPCTEMPLNNMCTYAYSTIIYLVTCEIKKKNYKLVY